MTKSYIKKVSFKLFLEGVNFLNEKKIYNKL